MASDRVAPESRKPNGFRGLYYRHFTERQVENMATCAYCGTEFTGIKSRKYCSRECCNSFHKDKMRMEYVWKSKREPKCVICGGPLTGRSTKYCSEGCRMMAKSCAKSGAEPHGLLIKTCIICGKEFSTYRGRQNTCSTKCSKKHSYRLGNKRAYIKYHENGGRTREEIHEEAMKRQAVKAAEREERKKQREAEATKRKEAAEKKKAENIAYWLEFSEQRVCECCGKEYTAHYPTSKYCSDKCSRHVSKKKRKYAGILVDPDITLRRLARRDGNICQICGLMVDWSDKMKAKGTVICGPMYPSIDHIYPVSKGGMHAWNNVQLAHRKCNTYKSDSIA